MSDFAPEKREESESSAIIPWTGRHRPTPDGKSVAIASKGFGSLMRQFWGWVCGNTASELSRLKEAGVRQVEAKAEKDFAEAQERLSIAAKNHAEADALRSRSESDRKKSDAETAKAVIECVERVEAMMSRIRQSGGTINFDMIQLQKYLPTTPAQSPGDPRSEKTGDH